jgi:hypothetical protein
VTHQSFVVLPRPIAPRLYHETLAVAFTVVLLVIGTGAALRLW